MRSVVLPITAIAALALAGCAAGPAESAGDDTITIVASTDVYGDIARAIAGDDIEVSSIIDGAAQDPHSYEATAQDRLAVSRADIVIENGGGYDPFIDELLEGVDGVEVINASEASGLIEGTEPHDHHDDEAAAEEEHSAEPHAEEGKEHAHEHIEGFNEHVWYSFAAMDELAHEISHVLEEVDAPNAEAYHERYEEFATELDGLTQRLEELHTTHEGTGAAVTEPVPLYLLEAAGLENLTPEQYSEAIEEGTDVAPAVLQETLDVIASGEVAVLAYNEQTAGPETERVREAAEAASVPVVDFTETLPDDTDYIGWMSDNIDALTEALS